MAVDARLLVLDEPTLGLDILYRKQFYDSLINDYFDKSRTIVVSTHQVDEIENILTDVIFLNRGKIVLSATMEEVAERFIEVAARPDQAASARSLKPVYERRLFDRNAFIFDGVARERLEGLGELRAPGLADLFIALMGPGALEAAA
jgi:ABC-2 type transport system ATP-binding protein